jgi:hypothetical protein
MFILSVRENRADRPVALRANPDDGWTLLKLSVNCQSASLISNFVKNAT